MSEHEVVMDLDELRSMGVDYTVIDRDHRLYEKMSSRKPLADEKRLLKLEINRIRMAERRANETGEERALRLYKNKMRNKVRRATETPEQRAARNRRNMERNRRRRNCQRQCKTEPPDPPYPPYTPYPTYPAYTPASHHSFNLQMLIQDGRKTKFYVNDTLPPHPVAEHPEVDPHTIKNIIKTHTDHSQF